LTGEDYFFSPDDTGSFTDTANYVDSIAECTNVSIGYKSEHTANETLDLNYLGYMAEQVLRVEWEALPKVRKAGEMDDRWAGFGGNYKSNYNPTFGRDLDSHKDPVVWADYWSDLLDMDTKAIVNFVRNADARDVTNIIFDMLDQISYQDERVDQQRKIIQELRKDVLIHEERARRRKVKAEVRKLKVVRKASGDLAAVDPYATCPF
jgi:hypothetical protein